MPSPLRPNRRRQARKRRMAALRPHERHEIRFGDPDGWPSYHTCRFCKRGVGKVTHLWKYGTRAWACDDCKTDVERYGFVTDMDRKAKGESA